MDPPFRAKASKTTQPVVQTSGGINASIPRPASKPTVTGKTELEATSAADGFVVPVVPAASEQRRVQVRVMAGVGWLTSECSITPVGA